MNKKLFPTVLLPLALLIASTASAQEPAAPKPDTWAATVDLAFSGASGNDRTVLLTSGFKISHLKKERFELEWSGSVRYGKSEGHEVARNLKSGVKLDLIPRATWSPFITVDAERDPFRKLDVRTNSGAGVKYTFWHSAAGTASLSAAVLHSYEDFTSDPDLPLEPQHSARWSWRFKGNRIIGERVRVENTTFYQPVWDRGSQYLLNMDSSLRVPMTRRISMALSHSYARDSNAPPGVHKDDHLVKAGLTIETRW